MSDAPVNLKTTLNSKAPQLALIMITMLWGGTFVAVKLALNYASPMFLSAAVLPPLHWQSH